MYIVYVPDAMLMLFHYMTDSELLTDLYKELKWFFHISATAVAPQIPSIQVTLLFASVIPYMYVCACVFVHLSCVRVWVEV